MWLRLFCHLLAQLFHLSLQFPQLTTHLGQASERGLAGHLFAFGGCRNTQDGRVTGDIPHNAGFGTQHRSISNSNVIRDANLPGHHNVISGGAASGNTNLGADQVMAPDAAVVGNHHLIIDLRPVSDYGRAIGPSVDCRAGPDFDIASDLYKPQLITAFVLTGNRVVAKPVGSDHRRRVNHRSRAPPRYSRRAPRWDTR